MNSRGKPSTSSVHTNKRKYTSLTIQRKLEALKKIDAGVSTSKIALEHNVNESTVRRWIHKRNKLETYSQPSTTKRIRVSPMEKVNEALTIWFNAERRKNNPISVIQIKVKAQQFFKKFGGSETFRASDGWLQNWKRRNGIRFLATPGEQLSAAAEAASEFKEEILHFIEAEQLSLNQIFNADEAELFYKVMPNKTLIFKSEYSAPGYDQLKDRLTIMTCCNANGSLKLPLLIIGKHKKPRVLRNLAPHLLPAKYTTQTSAWMSSAIFERWFKEDFVPEVVNFLRSQGLPEKAILLIDNAKSRASMSTLTVGGIRAIFFPTNVTSLIQPLDQGIIEAMNRRYKINLLKFIINAQADGLSYKEAMDSLSIKNAIDLISDAWDQISENTISNCWMKLLNVPVDEDDADDVTSECIHEMYKRIRNQEHITLDDINEWVHGDCLPSLTDEEIIDVVQHLSDDETDSSDNEESTESNISPATAIDGLNCAIQFFEQSRLITQSEMNNLKRIKRRLFKIKNQIYFEKIFIANL
nr:PREDICTED: jerky protein homolog-like isoform X1 [Megachile rotundata]